MSLDPATAGRLKEALATVVAALTPDEATVRPFEELRSANASADNVSVGKEALAQLGVCGRGVRPPSRMLPEAARGQIAGILAAWNPPRAEETP